MIKKPRKPAPQKARLINSDPYNIPACPADWNSQNKIWFVWSTRNTPRAEITDLLTVASSREAAEFAKAVILKDNPNDKILIEERITNHIYAHRCIELVVRLSTFRDGD